MSHTAIWCSAKQTFDLRSAGNRSAAPQHQSQKLKDQDEAHLRQAQPKLKWNRLTPRKVARVEARENVESRSRDQKILRGTREKGDQCKYENQVPTLAQLQGLNGAKRKQKQKQHPGWSRTCCAWLCRTGEAPSMAQQHNAVSMHHLTLRNARVTLWVVWARPKTKPTQTNIRVGTLEPQRGLRLHNFLQTDCPCGQVSPTTGHTARRRIRTLSYPLGHRARQRQRQDVPWAADFWPSVVGWHFPSPGVDGRMWGVTSMWTLE